MPDDVSVTRWLERLRQGPEHPDTATNCNNLALNLNRRGHYAAAESLLRKALAIFEKALGPEHPHTAESYNSLAVNLSAQGRYEEAAQQWRRGAAAFEVSRLLSSGTGLDRAVFAADKSPLAALAACLARLGEPEQAWEFAEAGLARGLLDDLAAQQTRAVSPEDLQKRQQRAARLQALDKQVVALLTAREQTATQKQRLAEVTKERSALLAEVSREAARRAKEEVFSLGRIQQQLPADAALLFWIDLRGQPGAKDPNGEHWACLVRRTGSPTWLKLPGSGSRGAWTADDDYRPGRLCQALVDPTTPAEERDRLARQLTAQRLTPLRPHLGARDRLPAVPRLVVLPAGWMSGVPLAEAQRCLRELPRAEAEKLAAALAGGELRGTVGPLRPLARPAGPVGHAGDRPFAHPYYWAAFVLLGDPD